FLRKHQGRWGPFGYIDRSGQWIIKPQFAIAEHFSEGLAAVMPMNKQAALWAYIDKSGHYITPPRFIIARPFSEGLGIVELPPPHYKSNPSKKPSNSKGKWGAIYPNGK